MNDLDNEFRWETLFTQIKKSSILVERLQMHQNPMLNFKLEKMLAELMKTLTPEEQSAIELESKICANIQPPDMKEEEFKRLKRELLLESQSSQTQYEYACTLQPEEEQQKIKWFTKAAEKQNMKAQYHLAALYGKKQDYKQAFVWYTKASNQGCVCSKNNLAVLYRHGHGVERDEKKAFDLYSESANGNNGFAMTNLGGCYQYGLGVEQDVKKAFEMYQRASVRGSSIAYAYLGDCYITGVGVQKDYKKAFEMYRSGDMEGNKECEIGLGQCYLNGIGVVKNVDTASMHFLRASNDDPVLAASFVEKYRLK